MSDRLRINQAQEKILFSILRGMNKNNLKGLSQYNLSGKDKKIKISKKNIIPNSSFNDNIKSLQDLRLVNIIEEKKKVWKKKNHRPKYLYTVSELGHFLLMKSIEDRIHNINPDTKKGKIQLDYELSNLCFLFAWLPYNDFMMIKNNTSDTILSLLFEESLNNVELSYCVLESSKIIEIHEVTKLSWITSDFYLKRKFLSGPDKEILEIRKENKQSIEELKNHNLENYDNTSYEYISPWRRFRAVLYFNLMRLTIDRLYFSFINADSEIQIEKQSSRVSNMSSNRDMNDKQMDLFRNTTVKTILNQIKDDVELQSDINEIFSDMKKNLDTFNSYYKKTENIFTSSISK